MSKQTYLSRYLFIIERLERSPATYDEISEYLDLKSETTGDDLRISQRTLQRDINDILLQTGYEIANERKGEKRYYIVSRPEDTDKSKRLLESYHLINIIHSSEHYADYVFLESRRAKGIEHFHSLLHAISNKLSITFSYLKYIDDSESERTVHPLALKEAIGRWYLAAVDTKDKELKTFGLDRISMLEIAPRPYREKYNYDIKTLFRNSFGIINDPAIKPETVKLSFTYTSGKYVKAYPLHISQKVISEDAKKNEVVMELFIIPSIDFIKEILSHGAEVKVIGPTWLKKEVKAVAKKMLSS